MFGFRPSALSLRVQGALEKVRILIVNAMCGLYDELPLRIGADIEHIYTASLIHITL